MWEESSQGLVYIWSIKNIMKYRVRYGTIYQPGWEQYETKVIKSIQTDTWNTQQPVKPYTTLTAGSESHVLREETRK